MTQSADSIPERLQYLRGEIRAERISYGEIAELQGLAPHIDPGDVELLEWAGVPEHTDPVELVRIEIPETHDEVDVPDLLRLIADQIENHDCREGYHPRWRLVPVEIPNG